MARLGVALGSGLSPLEIVECVKFAEECGYESAWVIEGHGGDQFSILTACGLATKRIKLGIAMSQFSVATGRDRQLGHTAAPWSAGICRHRTDVRSC
jgi:hypothetical protein